MRHPQSTNKELELPYYDVRLSSTAVNGSRDSRRRRLTAASRSATITTTQDDGRCHQPPCRCTSNIPPLTGSKTRPGTQVMHLYEPCVQAGMRLEPNWMPTDLQAVNYLPGYRILFWAIHIPGVLLPTKWWNMGQEFMWRRRFDVTCALIFKYPLNFIPNGAVYRNLKSENFSVVSWISGPAGIYTLNVDVARQVITGGPTSSFLKPERD
ncbi:hypothetical protein BDN71DRAFT_1446157 [Pleurotus eryngii]|uniref:Uncharacterized protein n=1 Tax=Pleurotus eryngii TaxID=5323 RepID=A0A9P5ZZE0_PLEER|nr:hypothetical protein BDN71DRAFT_1446157 [Pleurotus eryngii]